MSLVVSSYDVGCEEGANTAHTTRDAPKNALDRLIPVSITRQAAIA